MRSRPVVAVFTVAAGNKERASRENRNKSKNSKKKTKQNKYGGYKSERYWLQSLTSDRQKRQQQRNRTAKSFPIVYFRSAVLNIRGWSDVAHCADNGAITRLQMRRSADYRGADLPRHK